MKIKPLKTPDAWQKKAATLSEGSFTLNPAKKPKEIDETLSAGPSKGKTFLAPIADNGSQIEEIVKNANEQVFFGKSKAADALKTASAKVNALNK